MAIPASSALYGPLLRCMQPQVAYTRPQLIEALKASLSLNDADDTQLFESHVKQALTNMSIAGLVVVKEPHVYVVSSAALTMLDTQATDKDLEFYVAQGLREHRTQR